MPINVTPQQFADRWSQALGQSAQRISDGVDAVTQSPAQAAIKNKAKMVQNFTAAVNNGKWETNLGKISLQDWQQSMKTKGIPRIASGAQAANGKMAAFAAKLLPFQQTLQAKVKAMPNMTLPDNIARMTTWVTGMSQFQNK